MADEYEAVPLEGLECGYYVPARDLSPAEADALRDFDTEAEVAVWNTDEGYDIRLGSDQVGAIEALFDVDHGAA